MFAGAQGAEKRFLRWTGPLGRRVLRFDCLAGRGLWYRPSGDNYEVSVTGLAFYIIWHDKHSADWLAALASPYPASPDFHLKVKRLTMICASLVLLQIMFAVHASTGKRVTRFSGRFAPLRIVFPCHPYAGGRIKHRETLSS